MKDRQYNQRAPNFSTAQKARNFGTMVKTLSVIFTIALAVAAKQIASDLRRAGILPAETNENSTLAIERQATPFHAAALR